MFAANQVSARTVCRRLQQHGLSDRRPFSFSRQLCINRDSDSGERHNWIQEWHNVTFSDEFRLCVQTFDDRMCVQRLYHTTLHVESHVVAVILAHHLFPATTVDEVYHRHETVWNELPISVIQTQFNSMPNRIRAVLAATAGRSFYLFYTHINPQTAQKF